LSAVREPATLVLRHAREVLTMQGELPAAAPRADFDPAPLGIIHDGAVAVNGDTILAVGTTAEVERVVAITPTTVVIDVGDRLVAPGLIDAHTHALFVGDRSHEFSMRLEGATYASIAAAGGGIAASVRAVRAADTNTLGRSLRARLARMAAFGVTTVEVKTGYALDTAHELRCLDVIARTEGAVPTFLPLHAIPPELRARPDGRQTYLDRVFGEMLPRVLAAGTAKAIDAYIDGPGFSVEEARPVLEVARRAGLAVHLHVGQFEDVGGARLAAELRAASADHLEHVTDEDVRAMAQAGVTGVLLPGAAFSLGQPQPDARRLRALGLSVALATDCNPGTSHTESLPLMAAFGVRQMGLSTVEAWFALTRVAARALGREDLGRLARGCRADIAVLALPSWESLPYDFGSPRCEASWRASVPFHHPPRASMGQE
jgi:imidazolonepropionase